MNTKPLQLDVNEHIECAHTLASKFYTDPTVLEIEKTRIFLRTWQLVGTLSHECGEVNGAKRTIADPESFFTAEVAGEPIIVVRDKQGTLRAFSNVCRHRAGPIALGSGCKNVLRCQYHGWTYTLDGRLIGTPDVDGVEFFDRSNMGMVPVRVETWEQFIFVNFDAQAEPLAGYLGKIPEQAQGFQFEGLQFAERRDYVINCNWKVYVDNYLEGYHIPIAHPGLMREIDYAQYRTDTYRYYSQQFAPIRAMKADDSTARAYAPGSGLQQAAYFWVFPNLMLNIYPDNISTNLIVPLSHDKTLTIFEWFFHDVADSKVQERIQRAIAFSDEVQQEDIGLCENVQKGLRSSTYDRGRYSVKRENGVHHFHMLLGEFLGRT
ncbi:MAG: Rieske 2Fe-2S domain-containing protein [Acidobacteriota bacterium]|nr:Rieske 2Fe-2S domain-containing protein [Acidobacteriota bacterium]